MYVYVYENEYVHEYAYVHVYVYVYAYAYAYAICICVEYIRIYKYTYNWIYICNHWYDDIIIIAAVSCGHAKGPIDLLIQNAGYFMESGSQGHRVSWVW